MEEVKIGSQTWSNKNLNVSTFNNGDQITECKTEKEWKKAAKNEMPAFCYYSCDIKNDAIYGKLYNWFAINDHRGLAPDGWAIPSEKDWEALTTFLGKKPGIKLKAIEGWKPNEEGKLDPGTDDFQFNALPSGYCQENGKFEGIGVLAVWWSKTEAVKSMAYYRPIGSFNGVLVGFMGKGMCSKKEGLSVRLIKSI